MSDLINQPDAPRLIYGLRDTGYSFNTAAADIIDNSIAAKATDVNVRIELAEDGRKFVLVGDNGDGMSDAALFSAMRYGAPARSNLASLGKFGLGLKTASSSVCLKFTVISRAGADAPFAKLAWDLEHVEQTNQWEMLREPMAADDYELFEELCGVKGTLVIWSKCDGLLSKEYDDPGGAREQAAIRRLGERLIDHVSLIYHRFLDTADERERNVSISVNGEPVGAWNPFFPARAEQVLAAKQQQLEIELEDGTVETAHIRAWILPHRRDMTRDEQKIANISNRGQGFYIYREGRVIQQGGWLGVFGVIEPHYSLLRIEFDFSHKLDEAFKVDVKKSKILFDPALEDALRKLLQPTYREAGNRYRRTERKAAVERGVDHGSANKAIGSTPATAKPSVESADAAQKTATVSNNRGSGIKLRVPVDTNVRPGSTHVEAVETITSGDLWEPAMRSDGEAGFVAGVRINKHHDFYLKIYQRAAASGYAVEGMDLLLWAFAVAEHNNVNEELESIFEDIRNEISTNLKKLLREVAVHGWVRSCAEGTKRGAVHDLLAFLASDLEERYRGAGSRQMTGLVDLMTASPDAVRSAVLLQSARAAFGSRMHHDLSSRIGRMAADAGLGSIRPLPDEQELFGYTKHGIIRLDIGAPDIDVMIEDDGTGFSDVAVGVALRSSISSPGRVYADRVQRVRQAFGPGESDLNSWYLWWDKLAFIHPDGRLPPAAADQWAWAADDSPTGLAACFVARAAEIKQALAL